MAFAQLQDANLDEEEYDEEEIDISDLREKYEVQLEQGYDAFVVVDGLPEVTEEQKPKLVKFLLKKLNSVGKTREDLIYMPMGDNGKSLRYVSPGGSAAPAPVRAAGVQVAQRKRHDGMLTPRTDLPSSSSPPPVRPPPLSADLTRSLSTRSTPFALTSLPISSAMARRARFRRSTRRLRLRSLPRRST